MMRVFALSDIHVDFQVNMDWVCGLSDADYRDDILLLAGDVSDVPSHLAAVFSSVVRKFGQVFYVPGNHELWVRRCGTRDSLAKFDRVMQLAKEEGVLTEVWDDGVLCIIPMLSWYDFSFGQPGDYLRTVWGDFHCCVWPPGFGAPKITRHFLARNTCSAVPEGRIGISFSHFLPRIDVMPESIPMERRYLYPVLGSAGLGRQVEQIRPAIHIYGHSHVNRRTVIDGIEYVNNAYGYPSESRIARKELIAVYDTQTARATVQEPLD